MATRSNVVITNNKGEKFYLYHHYDGYPSGVGAKLNKVFKRSSNFRSANECANFINTIDHSYEHTANLHNDIEYLYTINIDTNTIQCQKVNNWEGLEIIKECFLVNFGSRRQFKDCD